MIKIIAKRTRSPLTYYNAIQVRTLSIHAVQTYSTSYLQLLIMESLHSQTKTKLSMNEPITPPSSSSMSMSKQLEFAKKKLVTAEDPLMLHKTFGLLALASFMYRYFWLWPTTGTLGFDDHATNTNTNTTINYSYYFNMATMACHLVLSTSSLIFHVLPKRIAKKPAIIWNEYRLHAIIFTMRCMSLFALYTTTNTSASTSASASASIQVVLILLHHVVADLVSWKYGEPGKTTVRGRHDKDLKPQIRWLTRVYAIYQFSALASHIVPHRESRGADLAFNGLVAIQSSAFLMTLYRKGLIQWYHHAIIYSACLALSTAYIIQCFPSPYFWGGIAIVSVLRIHCRISKYILWPTFAYMMM